MSNIDMMYMSMLSILLPATMAGIIFRCLPLTLKILSVFIFVTLLLEGLGFIFSKLDINNMAIFHVYTYVEFLSITLIYFSIFKGNSTLKWTIRTLVICFLILSAVNLMLGEHTEMFNSIQRVVEYVFLLIYFVFYLAKITSSRVTPFLELHPYFLLTVGFLIYFSGTLLLFLTMNQLEDWGIIDYWMIHGILNILLNITYFVVLWNGSKMAKHL